MRPSSLLRQTTPHVSKPLTLFSPSSISTPYIRPIPSSSSSALACAPLASSHSSQTSLRAGNPDDGASPISADDFHLYPHFFSLEQTRQLLAMSLAKLDGVDSVVKRRKRLVRQGKQVEEVQVLQGVLQDQFDQEYDFQEGHYDSVIHHYRESLLSTFPALTSSSIWPDYQSLMQRIYALLPPLTPSSPPTSGSGAGAAAALAFPPAGSTTHVLHLAPRGEIQAHVDNVDASGSVIIGVSLGASRVLRLREKLRGGASEEGEVGKERGGWDVLLPNGSLYLQKDAVRYNYEHSILPYDDPDSHWDGKPLERGHRLSLMVRDRASQPPG